MYTVYKHTCPNNKVYIGITMHKVNIRWGNGKNYKHNIHFTRAIDLYGWENIKHEVLFSDLTQEQAEEKEIELIKLYQSTNPDFGYNISNGGNHKGKHSDATRRKLSQLNKEKMVGEKNPMYGKKHKKESLAKMAEIKTGKTANLETRQKMSRKKKGVKFTKEHRDRIARALWKTVVCIDTKESYCSVLQASQITGISKSLIASCCRGVYKTAGGYHWKYVDGEVAV